MIYYTGDIHGSADEITEFCMKFEPTEDTSDLANMVEKYPKPYIESKAYIAGLLVSTEAKCQGIYPQSPRLEDLMIQYLSNDDTMLSEEDVKTLNAYALKGYNLIR